MLIKNIICKNNFKKINNVYVYLDDHSETNSFGIQWNKFRLTQIDSLNNTNSYDRFFNETGCEKNFFEGKNILEIGSGAGRFSNIILNHTSANLYTTEPSSAIFANEKNNYSYKYSDRFFLFKSSLYELPFEKNQFDIVICFGVLQHTPNIKETIKSLIENLKIGGLLFIDFYPYKGFWTYIHAKYFLRPITKRMKIDTLYSLIDKNLDFLIKIYLSLCKYKLHILTRFIPIADIKNAIPQNLNYEMMREIVLLDTIDMLTPKYDQPQKIKKIAHLIKQNNCNILFSGLISYKNFKSAVVRAKKI